MEDNIHYARGSGTVVEHSVHNPKIEGSYPAVGTGSWKMTGKMFSKKWLRKIVTSIVNTRPGPDVIKLFMAVI